MVDMQVLVCLCLFGFLSCVAGYTSQCKAKTPTWPQPIRQYDSRPAGSSMCQWGVVPFCPTGMTPNYMPKVGANDTLFVYAMKAPVWEFMFGDLLEKYHIMHDAIGFHHVQSGLNFTMEWYELYELFNCTFPHEPQTNNLTWCNQGAACIYMGIDEKHWRENGTLVKVSEISGDVFNKFANWTEQDNNTYPFYETWTVMDKPGGKVFFQPFDCASWVIRAFEAMHGFGATFNQSVHLNYTKIILYTFSPYCVGNETTIYQDPKTLQDLYKFYGYFQNKGGFANILKNLVQFLEHFLVDLSHSFYLFYNSEYWKLALTKPYVQITYTEVPLPS